MLEVVGVADLKREDDQDLTIPPEHVSPNALNVWLIEQVRLRSGRAK